MEAAQEQMPSAEAVAAEMLAQHNFAQQPAGAEPATDESQEVGLIQAEQVFQSVQERMAPNKDDEALFVEFFRHPIDGKDRIRIRIPGDNLVEPVFMADDYYKARFAAQWQAYSSDRSQFAGQTMLIDCGWVDVGLREHLNYHGIKTVEGLALVSDGNVERLGPGFLALRNKARDEIAARRKAKEYDAVKAEMEALRAQVSEQTSAMDEIASLRAEIAALKDPGKKPAK